MSVDQPKTIYVHLTELSNRLVKVALCFVVFFIACYEFSIKLQNLVDIIQNMGADAIYDKYMKYVIYMMYMIYVLYMKYI